MSYVESRILSFLALVLAPIVLTNLGASSSELNAGNVLALSKVHHETRSIGLELRCEAYERKLRELSSGSGQADLSASEIFRLSIEAEGSRRLPFDNRSPFLSDLQECAEKVPKYQWRDQHEFASLGRQNDPPAAQQEFLDQRATVDCTDNLRDLQQALREKDDEIQKLKEKLKHRTAVFDCSQSKEARKLASFENMKEMYYQVQERELRSSKKLEEANKRIAQLEAQLC